jgi:chaperone required for assembly of F1-ATPase
MTDAAPKRFYTDVTTDLRQGGFAVLLDGRQIRTPGKAPLLAPTRALAEACADEWRAQGETVHIDTMALTRLLNTAIDQTPGKRAITVESIAGYAGTDLVCHRAETPAALVQRQAEAWDPLVQWARDDLGAPLRVVTGVIAADQPLAAREAFAIAADACDDLALTGLGRAVGIAGSGVIGLALQRGRLSGDEAYAAACLDDLWQLETWGADFVAQQRLDALRAEFTALGVWFATLKA